MSSTPKPTDGRPWAFTTINDHPAHVFEPPQKCRFAVLILHTSTNEIPDISTHLARYNLAGCAPVMPASWWVGSAERHVVEHVVPWMCSRWSLAANAIAVVGTEMGGQGAVRLGFKYPDVCPIVASLNGAFDFHDWYGCGTPLDAIYTTRERARQDTATLNINPYKVPPHIWFACEPVSEWYRGNDRLDEKLTAYGLAHNAVLHVASDDPTAMIEFVAGAFDSLSRKLL